MGKHDRGMVLPKPGPPKSDERNETPTALGVLDAEESVPPPELADTLTDDDVAQLNRIKQIDQHVGVVEDRAQHDCRQEPVRWYGLWLNKNRYPGNDAMDFAFRKAWALADKLKEDGVIASAFDHSIDAGWRKIDVAANKDISRDMKLAYDAGVAMWKKAHGADGNASG